MNDPLAKLRTERKLQSRTVRNLAFVLLTIALVKAIAIALLVLTPGNRSPILTQTIRILASHPGTLPIFVAGGVLLWWDSHRLQRLRFGADKTMLSLVVVLAVVIVLAGLAVYFRYS